MVMYVQFVQFRAELKGIVQPKIKICSIFIPDFYTFLCFAEYNFLKNDVHTMDINGLHHKTCS